MQPTPHRTHAEKIALAAGSLTALAFVPTGAQAAIIDVTGHPVSLSMSATRYTTATWDVDGVGGADFYVWANGNPGDNILNMGLGTSASFDHLPSRANGVAFVVKNPKPGYAIQNLANGFNVGATLAAGYRWGIASDFMTMMASANGAAHMYPNLGLVSGQNLIGFEFKNGVNTLYGWADMTADVAHGTITINDWAYNDTPGGAIAVGQTSSPTTVPEPSTASLLLIGLGAAGVRSWRRRKQALNG